MLALFIKCFCFKKNKKDKKEMTLQRSNAITNPLYCDV